ncbi:MAG: glycosyl transferase [Gemmatimonas sp. SM23_52]|nr:MAG: glycosyl transferase [Gemmatimonas sp. SM23_52]
MESDPDSLHLSPRDVPGVDHVEWLVIDDGSADDTLAVARQAGVDHVLRLPRHQGLARAFVAGLEASLRAGADIIVNTDADNQYCADDIPKLIEPILRGEAEIVVGARPIDHIKHFSPLKRLLQRVGSRATRLISQTDVQDAPSGFRAFSREAAMRMHVFNEYTYTIETIIQAGQKGMAIVSVPIRINEDLRPSRLMKSLPSYLSRQILTMVRIFVTYKPFRFFASAGVLVFIVGLLISVRFLYFYFTGNGAGHIQSLILSALLMGTGFFLAVVGLVVDLISVNRQLLEILDWRMQKIEERVSDDSAALTGPRTRDEAQ